MNCIHFLHDGLASLGLTVDDKGLAGLCRYCSELEKWNRRINLVGKAATAEILENHFLDSLTLLPLLNNAANLMDVGSGAGFPGLVLKIVRPELAVTLVEPRQKRVSFLKQVVRSLGLEKIDIRNCRLEPKAMEPELAGRFQIVTSRAFTSTVEFLELALPYLAPGGRVICMKGPGAEAEIAAFRESPMAGRFSLTASRPCRLPNSGKTRNLLEFSFNE